MNPNLTQRRRGAEKERRGHGRLDRERHSTAIAAKPHDSMVGLERRCRPKPQARTRLSHVGPTPRSESTGWSAYFIGSFLALASNFIAL
jgi:hypothetical protein